MQIFKGKFSIGKMLKETQFCVFFEESNILAHTYNQIQFFYKDFSTKARDFLSTAPETPATPFAMFKYSYFIGLSRLLCLCVSMVCY